MRTEDTDKIGAWLNEPHQLNQAFRSITIQTSGNEFHEAS